MKIIVNIVLFFYFTTLFISCKEAGKTENTQGAIVQVARVVSESRNSEKEFSFIASPFRTSELSFRVSGPIEQFEVYPGHYYRRGEVIAAIDSRDFLIRKEQREATHNQAKAEFERIRVLYEKNNISASTFEKAKADYTSAKTAFETASNELNDTRLVAPFDGYVGEVYIEKHQEVKASQPVISFVDLSQLKIETYVTQDVAFRSKSLKEATLQFDAIPGKRFTVKIAEISKSTTPNNLSYLLTALLPNGEGDFLSGMSGKLFLSPCSALSEVSVVIPQTALCHRPTEGDYVWVVNPDTFQVSQRKVVQGSPLPNGQISVVSGLKETEVVAVSGLRFLSEGTKVEIAQRK